MYGRVASLLLALIVLTAPQPVRSQGKDSSNGFDLVNKTGNIRKPADVRDLYQLLGTYAPTDLNGETEVPSPTPLQARPSITERTGNSPMELYSLKKRSRPITPR